LRLRPDGSKGLPVSSLSAFRAYQRDHAWTWEHQALTRARFVAGDATIGAEFEAERRAILSLARDAAKLNTDVVAMRRRMYAAHPNRSGLFDLKHDPGGMVDIEFSVQYLVLAQAHATRSSPERRQHRAVRWLQNSVLSRPRLPAPRQTRTVNIAGCSTRYASPARARRALSRKRTRCAAQRSRASGPLSSPHRGR
jgi:glutamine synthetase adenylyltransferase